MSTPSEVAATTARFMGGACAALDGAPHEPLLDSVGDPIGSPIVGMRVFLCRHCRGIYCPETIGEMSDRITRDG